MSPTFFAPLRFGSLQIDFPVIQAALSGYSDAPMRKTARQFGCQFALCEVMLDQFVVAVSKRKSRYYFAETDEHPVGAQLMGSEPEQFVRAVRRLVDEGFDLIDLNFACPVKKVLGRKRGGYLMSDSQAALNIIKAVRKNIADTVPLTVKIRSGFDDTDASRENFWTLLNGIIDSGVCGITLHGRTVKQRYEGQSDWAFIKNVKEYLVDKGRDDITLIGSGDLFTPEICWQRLTQSGVNGLALARGVIGNPWLFRDVKSFCETGCIAAKPNLAEQRAVIAEHFRLALELYGERRAATTMRAFGVRYAQLHPETDAVRQDFIKTKTADDWQSLLEKWY